MSNQNTKRALLASVLSMALCIVMLAGSTFAWFTDTATASVNTIVSGELKVDIVDANDENISLKGQTLDFIKAEGASEGESILWEPGCTYKLRPFKVVNKGNLALKYKVVISGLEGDAKLLEAISFDYGILKESAEGNLAAGAMSDTIQITGHMDELAGNEYQDKTLENVSITVYATQDTVEYDSTTNQYDANASYFSGEEELEGLTRISNGFYTDDSQNFYASTAEGLKSMNEELATNRDFNRIHDKSYNLLGDINMNGESWNCVTLTTGSVNNSGIIFNGNGYKISNMNISGGSMFTLSASGSSAEGNTTVKNITFDNVTVTGDYHVGVIWGQMYGNIVVEDVHITNSSITGSCNVGAFIGRNGDDRHSTIKFIDCSVSDTTITANGENLDPAGASAFLGTALKTSGATLSLTFEGVNTVDKVECKSENGTTTSGGIYTKSEYNKGWQKVEVIDGFVNFDNRG